MIQLVIVSQHSSCSQVPLHGTIFMQSLSLLDCEVFIMSCQPIPATLPMAEDSDEELLKGCMEMERGWVAT